MTTTPLEELADTGSLCEDCGGLHVSGIEVAIIALHTAEKSGSKLPWCSCPDCPICRDFRARFETFVKSYIPIDATSHEDAL